ncbi:hypothetical protein FB451DRAFT_1176601 [Mycena latifolia]|nr:hypothetical protein FB451DRAFT_1176601 [Mycena latifolia]
MSEDEPNLFRGTLDRNGGGQLVVGGDKRRRIGVIGDVPVAATEHRVREDRECTSVHVGALEPVEVHTVDLIGDPESPGAAGFAGVDVGQVRELERRRCPVVLPAGAPFTVAVAVNDEVAQKERVVDLGGGGWRQPRSKNEKEANRGAREILTSRAATARGAARTGSSQRVARLVRSEPRHAGGRTEGLTKRRRDDSSGERYRKAAPVARGRRYDSPSAEGVDDSRCTKAAPVARGRLRWSRRGVDVKRCPPACGAARGEREGDGGGGTRDAGHHGGQNLTQFTSAAHHLALAAAAAQHHRMPAGAPFVTPPSSQNTPAATQNMPTATQTQPEVTLEAAANAAQDRRCCKLRFYAGPGVVSRQQHSDASGKKFHVAIPARKEGAFSEGFRKWEEATAYWETACRAWHGPVCKRAFRPPVTAATRISLTPMMLCGQFWAVQGIAQIFETRGATVAAAEDAGLNEFFIRGGYNIEALEEFALSEPL